MLDVSSNLLEYLPDSIGLLLSLKVLNVSGNKLNTLPESIAGCRYFIRICFLLWQVFFPATDLRRYFFSFFLADSLGLPLNIG